MPGLKLVAELGGDGSGFDRMMSRAHASAKQFGSHSIAPLKTLIAGAFTVGAIGTLVRKTADFADRIDETSSRLGVATDKLQEWEYAAKQSGASAEKLLTFIERLTIAAADPAKTKFFEQMGFNPDGMTPEQLFSRTAAFARGNSSTDVTRILSGIIGSRIGGTMVNTLQSDLDGLGEQARKVGAVLDQQTLQGLAKLNDQFSILSQILYGSFGPALIEAAKLALTAFHEVAGRAQQLKDAYSKLSPAENVVYKFTGQAGMVALLARLWQLSRNSPEGNAAYDAQMEKLAQMLAAMDAITPFVPGQVEFQPAAEKKRRAGALPTDALVGVGNFLGRNASLVNDVAAQHLQVAREQLRVQTETLDAVRAALRTMPGGFGVPGW